MTYLEILNIHFKKRKNAGYSLRALARDLDVSPSFVSGLLSGKKKIPLSLIESLAKRLNIDPETTLEMQRQLLPKTTLTETLFKKRKSKDQWQEGDKKQFSVLKQWFYVAILELVTCTGFDGTASYIARRLAIALPTVEVALRELQADGLLTLKNGRVAKAKKHLKLSAAQSIQEVRNFHRQMLKKAEEELGNPALEAFEKRLIAGITVSANPEKIAIAKKMLSDSLHEIASFLTDEEGTEVYQIAAQLFPLTKP
jgi:uncharacterized protein (TIGR02147 family)